MDLNIDRGNGGLVARLFGQYDVAKASAQALRLGHDEEDFQNRLVTLRQLSNVIQALENLATQTDGAGLASLHSWTETELQKMKARMNRELHRD